MCVAVTYRCIRYKVARLLCASELILKSARLARFYDMRSKLYVRDEWREILRERASLSYGLKILEIFNESDNKKT